jgi:hypothetical protein
MKDSTSERKHTIVKNYIYKLCYSIFLSDETIINKILSNLIMTLNIYATSDRDSCL